MSLITKYKLFENENKELITEELMKSILEKELFNEEVIGYFESYDCPFYPLQPKDYNFFYDEKEDNYFCHYEFENDKLGVLTSVNFNIRNFNNKIPYFRIFLQIIVTFTKNRNLFLNKHLSYAGNIIINSSGSEDIFKETKGKIKKQDKTLIKQSISTFKKIVKEDILKYGINAKSIKELFIGYKFIKKLEELDYVIDYSYKSFFPYKKQYKLIKYDYSLLKTNFPWSLEFKNNIQLYFDKFDRVFVFHEQYIYKIKKIYEQIKKDVENEFNN